jgi:hypothetical protein
MHEYEKLLTEKQPLSQSNVIETRIDNVFISCSSYSQLSHQLS